MAVAVAVPLLDAVLPGKQQWLEKGSQHVQEQMKDAAVSPSIILDASFSLPKYAELYLALSLNHALRVTPLHRYRFQLVSP